MNKRQRKKRAKLQAMCDLRAEFMETVLNRYLADKYPGSAAVHVKAKPFRRHHP